MKSHSFGVSPTAEHRSPPSSATCRRKSARSSAPCRIPKSRGRNIENSRGFLPERKNRNRRKLPVVFENQCRTDQRHVAGDAHSSYKFQIRKQLVDEKGGVIASRKRSGYGWGEACAVWIQNLKCNLRGAGPGIGNGDGRIRTFPVIAGKSDRCLRH